MTPHGKKKDVGGSSVPTDALRVLDGRVAHRVTEVMANSPAAWPCRKGCDACCRSLAQLPLLTAPEWDRMGNAIQRLEAHQRVSISRRIEASMQAERPVTCPLLDGDTGACLIYEARPLACRTYGFYSDREGGLYCAEIRHRFDGGEFGQVVWGNAEAVEQDLDRLGERRSLLMWWSENGAA